MFRKPKREEIKTFFDSLKLTNRLDHLYKDFGKKFDGQFVIGLHIRYCKLDNHEKYWQHNTSTTLDYILDYVLKIQDTAAKTHKNVAIFLTTDSSFLQTELAKKIDNILLYKPLPTNATHEAHYTKDRDSDDNVCSLAEQSLIEMFLLAKCDMLVRYTESWFSAYASYYVDDVILIPPFDPA